MTKFNSIPKKWREFSKNTRRNLSIVAYVVVFAGLITAVAFGYRSPIDSQLDIAANSKKSAETNIATTVSQSAFLDNVTEAEFATNVADNANLSIANAVRMQYDSLIIKNAIAQTNETIISKPIITIGDSSALTTYTVIDGDSVASIAAKFNISAQSVRWANDLTDSTEVGVGNVLTIPSVDGVVYTVKDGDTLEAVASKYQSNAQQIMALNGLGATGLVPGETIVLPGGVLPVNERPGYVAPVNNYYNNNSYAWGFSTVYAGNRYYAGQCVWYAYNRRAEMGRPVGSNWGNANMWDDAARASGWSVSDTPSIGAVFVTHCHYYGHVGIVEGINPDGSLSISDMNFAGPFRITWRTIAAPIGGIYYDTGVGVYPCSRMYFIH